MNFLALDSATSFPSASIFINDRHIETCQISKANSSSLPKITDSILQKNKISINELDYIAITIGPGSFTGIRVGLSFTQGLAYSSNIPITPVNILDAIAFQLNNKEEFFVAFHSHSNFIFSKRINGKQPSETKLLDINKIKGKLVYGIGLNNFQHIINFKKIKFSSKEVGEYSKKKYSNLICDKIENIQPIYLNEFIVSAKNDFSSY